MKITVRHKPKTIKLISSVKSKPELTLSIFPKLTVQVKSLLLSILTVHSQRLFLHLASPSQNPSVVQAPLAFPASGIQERPCSVEIFVSHTHFDDSHVAPARQNSDELQDAETNGLHSERASQINGLMQESKNPAQF
jgi:hypothetical protein